MADLPDGACRSRALFLAVMLYTELLTVPSWGFVTAMCSARDESIQIVAIRFQSIADALSGILHCSAVAAVCRATARARRRHGTPSRSHGRTSTGKRCRGPRSVGDVDVVMHVASVHVVDRADGRSARAGRPAVRQLRRGQAVDQRDRPRLRRRRVDGVPGASRLPHGRRRRQPREGARHQGRPLADRRSAPRRAARRRRRQGPHRRDAEPRSPPCSTPTSPSCRSARRRPKTAAATSPTCARRAAPSARRSP